MSDRPTFDAVRRTFGDHGVTWSQEKPFKNDDLAIGFFRRMTPDGRRLFATADYADGELIEPELLANWSRLLELGDVRVPCGDGHVSVRVPAAPPTPTPN